MIDVSAYRKVYKTTEAVKGLTFRVQPGEILGLVGPNGAGKTTTMRAIAGIIPPTSGTLMVAGHDVVKEPMAAKRSLAYVPDDPKLFDILTVWEHMMLAARTYGVADFEPRAEALLQRFELTEKRNALAQDLSRGMRQKVAICQAYLYQPRAVLFDEPLTGLDPRAIRTFNESIREEAANGVAAVISSHLLTLVEGLCTHLLILRTGECLFHGPIGEVRNAFGGLGADASLEDIFFHATEGAPETTESRP